jgi:hypothetical protein
MWWLMTVALWSMACAMTAEYVAYQKGRPLAEGFLLGVILGPIGPLVVALLPDKTLDPLEEDDFSMPPVFASRMPSMIRTAEPVEVDPSTWR